MIDNVYKYVIMEVLGVNLKMKSKLDFPIKIRKIEIKNFKNVQNGSIDFLKDKNKEDFENIIGLYGANGSGKTTFVNALDILKSYIADQVLILPNINRGLDFIDYFSIPFNKAEITSIFDISIDNVNIDVKYKLTFGINHISKTYVIDSEKLEFKSNDKKFEFIFKNNQYSFKENKNHIFEDIYDKLKIYIEANLKQLHLHSAFFNDYFMKLINENYHGSLTHKIIWQLRAFAGFNMFVITNKQFGFVNLQLNIPLNFRYSKNKKIIKDDAQFIEEELTSGRQILDLKKPQEIQLSIYEKLVPIFHDINLVFERLIPNTTIEIEQKDCILSDGNPGKLIELVTNREGVKIPLRNESTGILKLISIIQTLIAYCTHDDIFVAVDELDAGIFEYLLGELLELLAEVGRGQLFFTSHNLRPLEILNKNCIYFSTTNENNRYIRFANVKKNNNLRDFYFRTITLGGQKENVYNDHDIAGLKIALRKLYDSD